MLFWCQQSHLSMIMCAFTLTGKEGENGVIRNAKLPWEKVQCRHSFSLKTSVFLDALCCNKKNCYFCAGNISNLLRISQQNGGLKNCMPTPPCQLPLAIQLIILSP
uniref:Secreted protein n=1 Tax=Opuntia streptacantha TaxID=393608 RepID=A0A7C9CJE3_OPUST